MIRCKSFQRNIRAELDDDINHFFKEHKDLKLAGSHLAYDNGYWLVMVFYEDDAYQFQNR